jgi:hypothetical protein
MKIPPWVLFFMSFVVGVAVGIFGTGAGVYTPAGFTSTDKQQPASKPVEQYRNLYKVECRWPSPSSSDAFVGVLGDLNKHASYPSVSGTDVKTGKFFWTNTACTVTEISNNRY